MVLAALLFPVLFHNTMNRQLTAILLAVFTLLPAARADDKADATKVVESFYATYVAAALKDQDGDKVVSKSPQLSPEFKKAYADLIKKALKEDPELGLGYDPILCGQDFPNVGYKVKSVSLKESSGKVVLESKDPQFQQTINVLVVKKEKGWLINGIEELVGKP